MNKLIVLTLATATVAISLGAKPRYQACASQAEHAACFAPTNKHDAVVQANTLAGQIVQPYDQVWVRDLRAKSTKSKNGKASPSDAGAVAPALTEAPNSDKI